MHLCDRSGCVGLAVHVIEHLERRPAERPLDLRQQLVEGHRRHVAVQPLEFSRPGRRQEVLSARQHLAELDEGRPELLEGEPHALLRLETSDVGRFAPMQNLSGALEKRRDPGATHDVSKSVPDQDRADLAQAREVADGTEHSGRHRRA